MKILHSAKKWIVLPSLILVMVMSSAFVDNYFEISKNLEIFTSIYRELNIYYVDETKPGALMKTGVDAMLKSLDPYTVYYPESKIEDYRFMTTGQYGGIGAIIQTIDGKIVVAEPHEGFAAEKAGLKAGDVVLEIDGKSIEGKSQDDLSDILKGQSGTEVTLTIQRPGEDDTQDLTLTRGEVKIPDVPYYSMIDQKTGYIKLNGFTRTASQEVRTAFKDLKDKQGMQQLVFDLRGNGGGLLREAVNIVNFFVPKGEEIVSTRGKLEDWNKTHVALNEPLDTEMPIIILIDGASASASEIVSGALQDLDRAVVVGNQSFGKGLVQQTKDVAYNTKLKLTVAKYYIPSGRCIQKLDYSHRSQNGNADEVPDSLINEFVTKAGRPVFDGRGITPDVKVELEELSHVLGGIISNHIDFDWATEYAAANQAVEDEGAFRLSTEEYQQFVEYALTHDFEYSTGTEKYFEYLKEVAETERYFEGAEDEFDQLFSKIKPEKEVDMIKFKDQIKAYLEQEIASRWGYQTGRIENQLAVDPVMAEALQVFDSNYSDILSF